MYALFADKRPSENLSLYKIAKIVNSWGVPTKDANLGKNKKNGPNFWHERTIHRVLTNPVYTGETCFRQYTRSTTANSKKEERPGEEHITINTPAIVSKELFEKVRVEMQKNKNEAGRNRKQDTMLIIMAKAAIKITRILPASRPALKPKEWRSRCGV